MSTRNRSVRPLLILGGAILVWALPGGAYSFQRPVTGARPAAAQAEAGDVVSQVRALVVALDPHTAERVAERALEADPDNLELRAWWVLAVARAGRATAALEAAEAMAEAAPDSPWAAFALGAARMEHRDHWPEAPEVTEWVWEALHSEDAAWLHVQALITADHYDDAVRFVDEHWPGSAPGPRSLRQKSRALYYMGVRGERDQARIDEAVEVARSAYELAPDDAAVAYNYGVLLAFTGDREAGYATLERAARLSPGSVAIRQQLWGSLRQQSGLEAAEKLVLLEQQISELLEFQEGSAAALQAARGAFRGMPEAEAQSEALADRLAAEFPSSPEAEWLAVERYRAQAESIYPPPGSTDPDFAPDPEALASYRAALRDFLARDHFHRPTLRGDAYRELYSASGYEPRPDAKELLEIINGMVAYEGINPHISHAAGAIALAENTTYYERAEAIVRGGFEAARAKIEGQRASYRTQADFDESMDWMISIMHDALGWVYFQSGRIDEALVELEKAHELDPDNLKNLHHLGQVYEHEGDRRRAERFYVLGLNVDRPGVNPNRAALETLYEADYGSLDGFDEYLAAIAEADASARHEEILAARIEDPTPPPDFELRTLDGEVVRLADLRGKVAVVNFWGIWCYWCVIEMPDMQVLHERYADDPDVLILTINNDPDPDQVPGWMTENEYTFPVLLDDGYVNGSARIHAFPTTWFLDLEGRLAFNKEGWSQDLVQEYEWRIEALRTSR